MPNPYVGEIRMFAGDYAPQGWALCDGRVLAISQNNALFSVLKTTYGGDGRTTFALPDLRGRAPLHTGTGPGLAPRTIGEAIGEEQVTLTADQTANHSHVLYTRPDLPATQQSPKGNLLAVGQADFYSDEAATLTLDSRAVTESEGGSLPHPNVQPFLGITFIIALFGNPPAAETAQSQPFLGEIRMFAGYKAPENWAFCDGQPLPIADYNALFSVIGVTYGGDGRTVFSVPNLQGRVPIGQGAAPGLTPRRLGGFGGTETVGLDYTQIPPHTHPMHASGSPAANNDPAAAFYLAKAAENNKAYGPYPDSPAHPWALYNALSPLIGGSQAHNNMQAYFTLTFIIALAGEYPPHS